MYKRKNWIKLIATLMALLTIVWAAPILATAEGSSPERQKISEIMTYTSTGDSSREDYNYDEDGRLISLHSDMRGTKDEYYSFYDDGTMKQRNLIPVPDIFSDYYEYP